MTNPAEAAAVAQLRRDGAKGIELVESGRKRHYWWARVRGWIDGREINGLTRKAA